MLAQQQSAQQQLQFLALDHATRQRNLAFLQTELNAAEETQLVFLAPHRQLVAWRVVAEHVFPVDALQHRGHLVGGITGRIQAAHDGAHRGAGDAVDRHVLALEHLQHADVRGTARATATEHEAGARTRALLRLGAHAMQGKRGNDQRCEKADGERTAHGERHRQGLGED